MQRETSGKELTSRSQAKTRLAGEGVLVTTIIICWEIDD